MNLAFSAAKSNRVFHWIWCTLHSSSDARYLSEEDEQQAKNSLTSFFETLDIRE